MPDGLILFAHGARDPRWAEPFYTLLGLVQGLRPGLRVKLAYLELMEPGLPAAAEALLAEGCLRIAVRPLFLGTGGHLRRDLPVLMDGLRRQHPDVQWVQQSAIGEDAEVLQAMAQVVAAAAPSGAPLTTRPPD